QPCREGMQPLETRGLAHGGEELPRVVRIDVFGEEGDFDARDIGFAQAPRRIRQHREQLGRHTLLRHDGGDLGAMVHMGAMGEQNDRHGEFVGNERVDLWILPALLECYTDNPWSGIPETAPASWPSKSSSLRKN